MRNIPAVAVAVLLCAFSAWAQDYDQLIQQAEAKMMVSDYGEALDSYRLAFKEGPGTLKDFFNAACAAAQSGDADAAFDYLGDLLAGYTIEKSWLEEDEDLAILQSDPRWDLLLAAVDAKLEVMLEALPETHPTEPAVDLPQPSRSGEVSVEEALENRRSVRAYTDTPFTLAEISQLLWSAYGINKPVEKE